MTGAYQNISRAPGPPEAYRSWPAQSTFPMTRGAPLVCKLDAANLQHPDRTTVTASAVAKLAGKNTE